MAIYITRPEPFIRQASAGFNWLLPISNTGQATPSECRHSFWQFKVSRPENYTYLRSRCRLCAWTSCNNPLTVVQASACMPDRILLRQERWLRWYAPAVDACALTVVNVNDPSIPDTSHVNQLPRQKRILNIIAGVDAREQLAEPRQLSVEGRWLEWTDVMNSDPSWHRLLHDQDDSELSFSLREITSTLPTPHNLRRWGQLNRHVQPIATV